ncbi:ZIP family metal transporter [Geodermatophilus sp. CPCC 206100]|uniref:ZIP family metal transporter n=1 Tax=Geodermatophilus sp. CPCC 206100 TaxID=3020054 RepID=UPI003B00CCF9
MPTWAEAGLWGLLGGGALVLGALVAWFVRVPQTVIASVMAFGALLDGVPESVVLGLGLLSGGGVSTSVLAAVFISNVPEGLSSAAGMKSSGRSARYVFGVWGGIAVVSGLAALVGSVALGGAPPELVAVITAVAAGAILTMIADTMIPEAFERTRTWTGVITTLGFLLAFAIEVSGR